VVHCIISLPNLTKLNIIKHSLGWLFVVGVCGVCGVYGAVVPVSLKYVGLQCEDCVTSLLERYQAFYSAGLVF
jgi:hypothetical protein